MQRFKKFLCEHTYIGNKDRGTLQEILTATHANRIIQSMRKAKGLSYQSASKKTEGDHYPSTPSGQEAESSRDAHKKIWTKLHKTAAAIHGPEKGYEIARAHYNKQAAIARATAKTLVNHHVQAHGLPHSVVWTPRPRDIGLLTKNKDAKNSDNPSDIVFVHKSKPKNLHEETILISEKDWFIGYSQKAHEKEAKVNKQNPGHTALDKAAGTNTVSDYKSGQDEYFKILDKVHPPHQSKVSPGVPASKLSSGKLKHAREKEALEDTKNPHKKEALYAHRTKVLNGIAGKMRDSLSKMSSPQLHSVLGGLSHYSGDEETGASKNKMKTYRVVSQGLTPRSAKNPKNVPLKVKIDEPSHSEDKELDAVKHTLKIRTHDEKGKPIVGNSIHFEGTHPVTGKKFRSEVRVKSKSSGMADALTATVT